MKAVRATFPPTNCPRLPHRRPLLLLRPRLRLPRLPLPLHPCRLPRAPLLLLPLLRPARPLVLLLPRLRLRLLLSLRPKPWL